MYQIVNVKLSAGTGKDQQTGREFTWDNVNFHVVTEDPESAGDKIVAILKFKRSLLEKVFPQYMQLKTHNVEMMFDYNGQLKKIEVVK